MCLLSVSVTPPLGCTRTRVSIQVQVHATLFTRKENEVVFVRYLRRKCQLLRLFGHQPFPEAACFVNQRSEDAIGSSNLKISPGLLSLETRISTKYGALALDISVDQKLNFVFLQQDLNGGEISARKVLFISHFPIKSDNQKCVSTLHSVSRIQIVCVILPCVLWRADQSQQRSLTFTACLFEYVFLLFPTSRHEATSQS